MNIKTIAEIGSNWNGDEKIGKKIIKAAKLAGADYVKFQMWKASDLYKNSEPFWNDIKRAEVTPEIAKKFKKYSDEQNIKFFCSVFYPEAVETLENLNVKLYKIASWTAAMKHKKSKKTLETVAETKKPVIISTGMGGNVSTLKQIFRKNKRYFLYCISKYPTKINQLNFTKMKTFDGFSDHTEGFLGPTMFALNFRNSKKTKFYEKHVSITKSRGPDKPFSMSMNDFGQLVSEFKKIQRQRL
jgi:sialic acid synthase SpsE